MQKYDTDKAPYALRALHIFPPSLTKTVISDSGMRNYNAIKMGGSIPVPIPSRDIKLSKVGGSELSRDHLECQAWDFDPGPHKAINTGINATTSTLQYHDHDLGLTLKLLDFVDGYLVAR